MQLKRHYKDGVIDSIEVKRYSENQKFSQKFINNMMADGFVTMTQGKIVLHTQPELTYAIKQVPGYYCCHDGKKMDGAAEAQKYIDENFAGVESPDKNNPAGYCKQDFYNCVLEK